jgi:hypothetical protein
MMQRPAPTLYVMVEPNPAFSAMMLTDYRRAIFPLCEASVEYFPNLPRFPNQTPIPSIVKR